MISKESIATNYQTLQNEICQNIESADGAAEFISDHWQRPGGGGGDSRIIKGGKIIEKGGVNFSAVHGPTPENILQALQLPESSFFATGISIVMHPVNPMVPIIHMNLRYFEMDSGHWWFGGGIDLTPHYIDEKDAAWFHRQIKIVCDRFDTSYYDRFKNWADDYFFLKHRNETRGVGGIFFDRLDGKKDELMEFSMAVGKSFAPIYTHIMNKNSQLPFGEDEKKWQTLRRGRYVEFNLVWDKGTKFGLETNGRTESILMSLPPIASWEYNYQPEKGSREEKTLSLLKKNIDWLTY